MGLMSGIAFTDPEGRPERLAARGGVGAVMGSKKVKAIVVDKDKMPTFHDRKGLMQKVRKYSQMLAEDPAIESFTKYGTAMMGDFTNKIGGLPTRNFSSGQAFNDPDGRFKLGGDFIFDRNTERGGHTAHACMPGCMIKCSNIYVDEDGKEMVSPMEYETIGLMGTNCGLTDPDDVARVNFLANDLGIDTIEAGATIAVLMAGGEGEFGDVEFMVEALEDMRKGNERGRIIAQGTGRVGEHYKVKNVPVIKNQGISAYDPRVIEVTGISMMVTAQGADHTAGNLPAYKSKDKPTEELVEASLDIQELCAAADSLGLCIFGRSVTNENLDMMVEALNDAHDANLTVDFYRKLGREALVMEWQFNKEAGFTEEDDELPEFFFTDALAPTGAVARHRSAEVNASFRKLLEA
jgi:aldehyde:ferredoxin oxidoreductase